MIQVVFISNRLAAADYEVRGDVRVRTGWSAFWRGILPGREHHMYIDWLLLVGRLPNGPSMLLSATWEEFFSKCGYPEKPK